MWDPKEKLCSAINTVLGASDRDQDQNPMHAVVISFHYSDHIDVLLEALAKYLPGLRRIGDYLIAFLPKSQCSVKQSLVNDFLNKLDENELAQAYKPDWLENYELRKKLGVDYVSVDDAVNPSKLDEWLEKQNTSKTRRVTYLSKVKHSNRQATNCSDRDIVLSFVHYLNDTWTGIDTNALDVALTNCLQVLREKTLGVYFLGNHPCQELLFNIKDKARALPNTKGLEERVADVELRYEKIVQFESLEKPDNKMWRDLDKAISLSINEALGQSEPHGYSEAKQHYNDDDRKPLEAPTEGYFISWGNDHTKNNHQRLAPEELLRGDINQGRRIHNAVAGAFAAYYLSVMEGKHLTAFEAAMRRYATDMESMSYEDALLHIAADTRPNL